MSNKFIVIEQITCETQTNRNQYVYSLVARIPPS